MKSFFVFLLLAIFRDHLNRPKVVTDNKVIKTAILVYFSKKKKKKKKKLIVMTI